MFCHGCLKWGTPFADREDHECGNCGSRETDRYVEEPALIGAAAREAELAGALERLIGEIEAYNEQAPVDDQGLLESVCDRAKAALASPSRGAESYRLAKALALRVVINDRDADYCIWCGAEAKACGPACELGAFRAHEEASCD